MDEPAFWRLIDELNAGLPPRGAAPARSRGFLRRGRPEPGATAQLTARLQAWAAGASDEELIGFRSRLLAAQARANRWDLWAAGWLALDGLGDDGFLDFRTWLVLHGKAAFDRVVSDPEALVELSWQEEGQDFEDAERSSWVVPQEWERRHGDDPALDAGRPPSGEPVGEPFDEDDADRWRARFPRLSARHPSSD